MGYELGFAVEEKRDEAGLVAIGAYLLASLAGAGSMVLMVRRRKIGGALMRDEDRRLDPGLRAGRPVHPWAVAACGAAVISGCFSGVLFLLLYISGLGMWNPADASEHPVAAGVIFLPELMAVQLAIMAAGTILRHRRSRSGLVYVALAILLSLGWVAASYVVLRMIDPYWDLFWMYL